MPRVEIDDATYRKMRKLSNKRKIPMKQLIIELGEICERMAQQPTILYDVNKRRFVVPKSNDLGIDE